MKKHWVKVKVAILKIKDSVERKGCARAPKASAPKQGRCWCAQWGWTRNSGTKCGSKSARIITGKWTVQAVSLKKARAQILSPCLLVTPSYHFPEILPGISSDHVYAVSCVDGEAPYIQQTEPWSTIKEQPTQEIQDQGCGTHTIKSTCASRKALPAG